MLFNAFVTSIPTVKKYPLLVESHSAIGVANSTSPEIPTGDGNLSLIVFPNFKKDCAAQETKDGSAYADRSTFRVNGVVRLGNQT